MTITPQERDAVIGRALDDFDANVRHVLGLPALPLEGRAEAALALAQWMGAGAGADAGQGDALARCRGDVP